MDAVDHYKSDSTESDLSSNPWKPRKWQESLLTYYDEGIRILHTHGTSSYNEGKFVLRSIHIYIHTYIGQIVYIWSSMI